MSHQPIISWAESHSMDAVLRCFGSRAVHPDAADKAMNAALAAGRYVCNRLQKGKWKLDREQWCKEVRLAAVKAARQFVKEK